jgi:3-isopropylmalate/(R)-2-methylmalate dehydratase large subunit
MAGSGSHVVEAQIKKKEFLIYWLIPVLYYVNRMLCLAMNDDKVPAGKYAVSTSNRNLKKDARTWFKNVIS